MCTNKSGFLSPDFYLILALVLVGCPYQSLANCTCNACQHISNPREQCKCCRYHIVGGKRSASSFVLGPTERAPENNGSRLADDNSALHNPYQDSNSNINAIMGELKSESEIPMRLDRISSELTSSIDLFEKGKDIHGNSDFNRNSENVGNLKDLVDFLSTYNPWLQFQVQGESKRRNSNYDTKVNTTSNNGLMLKESDNGRRGQQIPQKSIKRTIPNSTLSNILLRLSRNYSRRGWIDDTEENNLTAEPLHHLLVANEPTKKTSYSHKPVDPVEDRFTKLARMLNRIFKRLTQSNANKRLMTASDLLATII